MRCKTFASCLLALLFTAEVASAQARIMPSFRANQPASITVTPGARYPAAITDLPYSADTISEHTLSDGTHMSRSAVHEFRDSLGRRREEHSGQGFGSLTIIEISDPVAGFDWVLDPADHVAYRMVREKTSRAGSRDLYPCELAGQPTTQTMSNGNTATNQWLGTQTLEGIEACGHRNAITQKDGSPGITSELWTSRGDIGSIVLSRTSDLQGGNNVTRLVNVRFSEPDAGLFEIPAQFRVVDETAAFTITESATAPQTPAPAHTPISRTVVALTGMPWSGDVMNGSTLLASHARDSMGRTWRENPGISTVAIVDPVAAYSYTLDMNSHIAHRRRITVQSKPAADAAPVLSGSGTRTWTLPSGVISQTESLGSKTIGDVVAYGTRVTLTYPPGTTNGNDKTTSTINESWVSPQLGVSLLMQNSGALVPTFTDRLVNLKYQEPNPALFRIPDGYQIVDDQQ